MSKPCVNPDCENTARVWPTDECMPCAFRALREPQETTFGMRMARVWSMASPETFELEPIEYVLRQHVEGDDGMWLDPFAGDSDVADVTNDLDPDASATSNMEALEFLSSFASDEITGGVLFDPPYSYEQISRAFDGVGMEVQQKTTTTKFWADRMDEVQRILDEGAKVVSFGWNSGGMGTTRGFGKEEVVLVNHGGHKNDTICVVEEYHG